MFNTNRTNPFVEYYQPTTKPESLPILTAWEWNLDGLVADGRDLSFSGFKHRPNVYRPLLSALWSIDVQSIPPAKYTTISSHRILLQNFERYLASHLDVKIRNLSSLEDLTRETLLDCRQWMHDHLANSTAGKTYCLIAKLLKTLQGSNSPLPGTISPELEIPLKSLRRHDADRNKILAPYTKDEEAEITAACKKSVSATLQRLSEGERLLKLGQDPRVSSGANNNVRIFSDGWRSVPNLLWYITHELEGRMVNRNHSDRSQELLTRFTENPRRSPIGRRELYRLLYPESADIAPFIVFLSLKTGLNAESILTLKRDCLLSSNGNTTAVRYSKERGSHEQMIRHFSHKGASSPVGIIKTVLKMTEGLVLIALKELRNELWLSHVYAQGQRNGECHEYGSRADVMNPRYIRTLINGRAKNSSRRGVVGFMEKNGIKNRHGTILRFSFIVARKTEATKEYLKHGNLANVSKKTLKHHGGNALNTTVLHYLANEATHHVHNQAVRDAQDKVVAEARRIVIDDKSEESQVAPLAKQLSESEERITSILSGEQDVFVASCRDFYNKPGGAPNTPCGDPWECFGCSNALWTSRILPRLMRFLWFVEEQRQLLHATDWNRKFSIPHSAITADILPRFNIRTIEWAKAEAKDVPFYVPPHLREA